MSSLGKKGRLAVATVGGVIGLVAAGPAVGALAAIGTLGLYFIDDRLEKRQKQDPLRYSGLTKPKRKRSIWWDSEKYEKQKHIAGGGQTSARTHRGGK